MSKASEWDEEEVWETDLALCIVFMSFRSINSIDRVVIIFPFSGAPASGKI